MFCLSFASCLARLPRWPVEGEGAHQPRQCPHQPQKNGEFAICIRFPYVLLAFGHLKNLKFSAPAARWGVPPQTPPNARSALLPQAIQPASQADQEPPMAPTASHAHISERFGASRRKAEAPTPTTRKQQQKHSQNWVFSQKSPRKRTKSRPCGGLALSI